MWSKLAKVLTLFTLSDNVVKTCKSFGPFILSDKVETLIRALADDGAADLSYSQQVNLHFNSFC